MKATKTIITDALVIGSGVAGLMTASHLRGLKVLLVAKGILSGGPASKLAQGGIAAVTSADDNPALHAEDTKIAGAGLCDESAVDLVASEGESIVEELLTYGANFDRTTDGTLCRGREAAHSRNRVLHAGGDRTGAEIVRALQEAVQMEPLITIAQGQRAIGLRQRRDGTIVGAYLKDEQSGEVTEVMARAVVLATGGAGGLFRYTTNPRGALAQGLGLAASVGAALADVEFVQFHPTALNLPQLDPLPLITEALRGAGAYLVNCSGTRFMTAIDPRAELAPRDIVARAVAKELGAGRVPALDGRLAVGEDFPKKFPTAFAACMSAGIDPRTQVIPVAPAAHYHMGGVLTDTWGRTSLPGLWACGEVACTGLHGANRLASNSLLEGLVFGRRVAASIHMAAPQLLRPTIEAILPTTEPTQSEVQNLRDLMWSNVGLLREQEGLLAAEREIYVTAKEAMLQRSELALSLVPAWLIARAARLRTESRGGHARIDQPATSDLWKVRIVQSIRHGAQVQTSLLPITQGVHHTRVAVA